MAPVQRLFQENHHEHAKDDQGNRLLRDLELARAPPVERTEPIGGHSKTIFEQRNGPADADDPDQRAGGDSLRAALNVPIPRHGHENVRQDEERYCWHLIVLVVFAAFAQHTFFVIVISFATVGAHVDHAAADHLLHVIDKVWHSA